MLENISYSIGYGWGTALIRAVTAVPGHACFGVFMGAFYGFAKQYERIGRIDLSRRYRKFAVVVSAFIHGCYDLILSVELPTNCILYIYNRNVCVGISVTSKDVRYGSVHIE